MKRRVRVRCRERSATHVVHALLACIYLGLTPLSAACSARPFASAPAGASADGSVYPTPLDLDIADLVRFPSPEIEFIAGPQLKSGSSLNPVKWFDENAIEKGLQHGAAFPARFPRQALNGTVSVTKGSNTVVGANTKFVSDLAGSGAYTHRLLLVDSSGMTRSFVLTRVIDDTHLTVSVAWPLAAASGLQISKVSGDESDSYINLNYYDQALCQYINYYRTGDTRFLSYARKIADSWWGIPEIAEGRAEVENSLAPRNASLNGLMLRALDGRPEMWPWITTYVREQFHIWVGLRVKYDGFYFGIRDPGYMLLYAANLARVHPDAKVRAEFREKVLDAAINYYGRLQNADGGFYFNLDSIDLTTQPFQVGILAEGLIAAHRLTGDEKIKLVILKSAEHQFKRCYNARGWRGMYYFVGGKTKDTKESCEKGCGAASNPFPPSDTSLITEVRQLNGTTIHQFGYAYLISGDANYKTWGDEILESTFGSRDGYRGLAAARAKEYDESYRSSGRYLVWRLAHGATAAIDVRLSSVRNAVTSPNDPTTSAVRNEVTGTPDELVRAAKAEALKMSAPDGAASESGLQLLIDQIEAALAAVEREPTRFLTPAALIKELKAASSHAKLALLVQRSGEDPKMRIGWVAARLKRAVDRIQPKPSLN